jgi:hypothetical protein
MPLVQERRGRSAGHARGGGVADGGRAEGWWATGRVTGVTGGGRGDDGNSSNDSSNWDGACRRVRVGEVSGCPALVRPCPLLPGGRGAG